MVPRGSISGLGHAARGLGYLVLPPVCVVCGLSARPGLDCCADCEQDLPVPGASCRRCALELVRSVDLCGRCIRHLPAFDQAFAGFAYRGGIERLVQRYKFRHDLAAGRVLAGLLARRLAAQAAPRPDLMVPVPLHWRRRLMRGFNQSELLCADLSRHFGGLPWRALLGRRRATAAQSELPADKRTGNVRGAFHLRRGLPARHVALVDDVMTTGSTLDECARVLKRAGVSRIDVWVVARA
ncbi:ComF family protein [Wenzhouxiangella sp. AB-CW3]|uniref:ComF family protein n=1 Tax=Wenzhouxiangella sp. AB-CW3 TaxID=2771012 RepID=UPI00168A8EEA|nr:ComF family protein [Wenzhouxiangella sp. AB-CW3]QOC22900.1 ComF family protein [Wenzhouxiangella sp. AB-CW3]